MQCKVLKSNTSVTNITDASDQLIAHILGSAAQSGYYTCVFNVHMCMIAFDDNQFAKIINNADLVVPDGRPIVWAQKLFGYKNAQQVRGMDLMLSLCARASREKFRIGLLGGDDSLLHQLSTALLAQYPELIITVKIAPPFRELSETENQKIVDQINSAGTQILFVALGCPKQEKWMALNRESLHCVMLGVGAAFDFIAGTKIDAPKWMQHIGLEWLFRLLSEPKRLWYRYLYYNPRFVWHLIRQFLHNCFR